MANNYKCWVEDYHGVEPEEFNVAGLDPEYAAQIFSEMVWHELEYPETFHVSVRNKQGEKKVFTVEVDMQPHFSCFELKSK